MGQVEALAILIANIGPGCPVLGARCYSRDDADALTAIFVFLHRMLSIYALLFRALTFRSFSPHLNLKLAQTRALAKGGSCGAGAFF